MQDVRVSKEDQANINAFSKGYSRRGELAEELKQCKETTQLHQDAIDELDIADESDQYRYRFGTCFLELPVPHIKSLVDKQLQTNRVRETALEKEIMELDKHLGKLKAVLYAKFGSSINLEE